MATPDIGKTVSDGYRGGFERMAAFAPAAIVPALVVGVIAGVIAQVQVELVPDAGELVANALSGKSLSGSKSDIAIIQLLGAVGVAVQLVIGYAGMAVFGGLIHRQRHAGTTGDVDAPHDNSHDGSLAVPTPGNVMGSIATAVGNLMPKLGLLVILSVAGTLVSIVNGVLGALVGLPAFIALVYFGIRWTYVSIVAGSGEATGDAAYTRSEEVVDGNFWGTFGVMFVVGLALVIPVAIIGAIVGAILPTAFLSALGSTVIMMLAMLILYATALESAWTQIESGGQLPPPDTFDAPPARPIDPDAPSF